MPDRPYVCVYCGSSNHVDRKYIDLARTVGAEIGRLGYGMVYGGGHVGLMGEAADGAVDAGSPVVGIIPEHLQQAERRHERLTELLIVDSMHTRKRLMCERADAFLILPGGLGTLDETFEILTWRQLGLHDKPIVVLNYQGYWDGLLQLIDHAIAEGFVFQKHRRLFEVVTSVEEAFALLSGLTPSETDTRLAVS